VSNYILLTGRTSLQYFYLFRSIEYKINEHHQFHVVAKAQVVSVALELSRDKITLQPTATMAAESGRTMLIILRLLENTFLAAGKLICVWLWLSHNRC
jgi:hypothetical protein